MGHSVNNDTLGYNYNEVDAFGKGQAMSKACVRMFSYSLSLSAVAVTELKSGGAQPPRVLLARQLEDVLLEAGDDAGAVAVATGAASRIVPDFNIGSGSEKEMSIVLFRVNVVVSSDT